MKKVSKKVTGIFIVQPNGQNDADHKHIVCKKHDPDISDFSAYVGDMYDELKDFQSLKTAKNYCLKTFGIKNVRVI